MVSKRIKKRTASRASFGDISLVLGAGLFLVGCLMLATTFTIWDHDTPMRFVWLSLAAFCCVTPIIFLLCMGFGIGGLIFDKRKLSSMIGMLLAFLYIALFFASYAR